MSRNGEPLCDRSRTILVPCCAVTFQSHALQVSCPTSPSSPFNKSDLTLKLPLPDIPAPSRRPLGFRPGVHKSESAKEMLLSQQLVMGTNFGPLPPSPTDDSSPEHDGFPPLPPSPLHEQPEIQRKDVFNTDIRIRSRHLGKGGEGYYHSAHRDNAPVVPPHRQAPSLNTLKTRSMDAGFSKSYRSPSFNSTSSGGSSGGGPHHPGTLPPELPGMNSRRRLVSGAFPKKTMPSPREERRLQTSCSLPETPIFARG